MEVQEESDDRLYRAALCPTEHLKLSPYIETDSRPEKRKNRDSLPGEESHKRLRSASVEPPPQPLAPVDPPLNPESPDPEPTPPAPKPPLRFRKNKTMDTDATLKMSAGVVQMTNGQQYTAKPPSGFPMTQCMESPWRNASPLNKAAWAEVKGPKGWLRVYRAKYTPNPRDVISKLSFVIKRLVKAPEVLIAPPTSVEDLEERLPAPWNFLLSSISEESLQKLIDGGLWSTPTISFFVFPYEMPLPNYIMTIQNLTANDDEEGTKFVARTVKEKLKSIKEASDFVINHCSKDDKKAAADFLDTIQPRPSRSPSPGAGQTSSSTSTWTSSARTIRYDTVSHGSGVARTGRDQLFCVGCKGYDHPTGLCPILCIIGIFLTIHKLAGDDNATLQKSDERAAKKAKVGKRRTTARATRVGAGISGNNSAQAGGGNGFVAPVPPMMALGLKVTADNRQGPPVGTPNYPTHPATRRETGHLPPAALLADARSRTNPNSDASSRRGTPPHRILLLHNQVKA
ncbi:hypothetical protein B0H13DRAFT_2687632 [Mycena leptocephala]|nr:hypothetical protein B0H13DRAFT_2687632 [Mycena leptocephala]